MKAEIRLSYGRSGETYHGSFYVMVYPTRGYLNRLSFDSYTFPRMMSKLAQFVREYEETEVVLERLEIKGSSYRLDAETVSQLRTDPASAISHMMPDSRVVVIRDPAKHRMTPPSGLLRAGHDTVAAAFGDSVYCASNEAGRIECPACGRWAMVAGKCTNDTCQVQVPGTVSGMSWFITATQDLLQLNLKRYYLPRSWNPSRGWISHEELTELHEAFKEERERCYQESALRE